MAELPPTAPQGNLQHPHLGTLDVPRQKRSISRHWKRREQILPCGAQYGGAARWHTEQQHPLPSRLQWKLMGERGAGSLIAVIHYWELSHRLLLGSLKNPDQNA